MDIGGNFSALGPGVLLTTVVQKKITLKITYLGSISKVALFGNYIFGKYWSPVLPVSTVTQYCLLIKTELNQFGLCLMDY